MSVYVQANTNGRLHDAAEPSISPLNRGYLYGDSIYEVWRTYNGVLFAWEQHWNRLRQSASSLFIDIPFSPATILLEIKRTVAAFRENTKSTGEVYVRLQIARGEGVIGLDTAFAGQSSFVLLVQENKMFSAEKFAAGLHLSLARDLRRNSPDALNPAWKTGNYLNNILCLREARSRGADEVVICNQRGEITEAAVSNIAFVRDGEVLTPPLSAGILAGITRQLLLDKVGTEAGIKIRQETIFPAALSQMEECFLLSSTKDITPVSQIDEHRFHTGEKTTTLQLKAAFARVVQEYVLAHPELKVL